MSIADFIQNEVLLPRLMAQGVLVVYDPARRYRDLCAGLATENRKFIDASETSIESREAAMAALQDLGRPNSGVESLLVYVPAAAPLTDEEKQRDPFAVYGVCGGVFPEGDGDEFQSLCLKAKPDQATEIRRVFAENPNPSFQVIDAVDGGGGWPNLQAVLGVESARDILFALLVPSAVQKESLKGQDAWVAEGKQLLDSCLGLKVLTRAKSWSAVADELWRFVLISEFVFDLPQELPAVLMDVPRAADEARPLVEDICDRLRNDRRTQPIYIERAEAVEGDLNLRDICREIVDLGKRDTFPFEEQTYFAQVLEALKADDLDRVREILAHHSRSIWIGKGESQVQWLLLESAAELIEASDDASRQLPDHAKSQDTLLDFYLVSLREVDRLQREFEQAASDYVDVQSTLDGVVAQARRKYGELTAKVQDLFVKYLESAGWPPSGRLANVNVFDRMIAPKLTESGRRVAYVLIDALRYELGVALEKQLAEDGQVEFASAFAPLPTVTSVGMGGLLPEAGIALSLVNKDGECVPVLGGKALTNVTQRMEVLRGRYGARFQEVSLSDFVRKKLEIGGTVDLLVVRNNTIDSHLEAAPEMALRIIHESLKQIRVALHRLREMGFLDVVIATDHGFFLNSAAGPGDVCAKPPGNWINIHDRALLGNGSGDGANFVLPCAAVGVRGDFAQIAGPRGMVSYRAGEWYCHGGASLQEAVVPVICVRLEARKAKGPKLPTVEIRYTRESQRITTRVPVVDIVVGGGDLFSQGLAFEILLEAHDKKGSVVGEAKPGGVVDPATRAITLRAGGTVQVPIKMDLEFEGKFTVKALDPTTFKAYCRLDLETDYMV